MGDTQKYVGIAREELSAMQEAYRHDLQPTSDTLNTLLPNGKYDADCLIQDHHGLRPSQ